MTLYNRRESNLFVLKVVRCQKRLTIFSLHDKIKYMKRKIVVKDQHGHTESGEINVRDEGIVTAQRKYPAQIFKNKKKYSRKEKHKRQIDIDE